MSALADKAGVRRQTLYEWFRPNSRTEPSLPTLRVLAAVLGVRRVDLLAAMDGVTAPEQHETPPPQWAEALANDAAEKAISRLVPSDLMDAARRLIERLEGTQPQPDATLVEEGER